MMTEATTAATPAASATAIALTALYKQFKSSDGEISVIPENGAIAVYVTTAGKKRLHSTLSALTVTPHGVTVTDQEIDFVGQIALLSLLAGGAASA